MTTLMACVPSYRICLRLSQTDNTFKFKPISIFEKLPRHLHATSKQTNRPDATSHCEGKTTNDWRFGPVTIDWLDRAMSSAGISGLSVQEKAGVSVSTQHHKLSDDLLKYALNIGCQSRREVRPGHRTVRSRRHAKRLHRAA